MTGSLVNASRKWFAVPNARPEAAVILFCLPYAGGGASAFRDWWAAAPPSVELRALQLPGREIRIGEQPRVDVDEIADALVAQLDRPYAIYGHSMGARLGFELIRRMRRRGAPMPLRFYLGGARPPDLVEPLGRLSRRSDDELARGVADLGGTPAEVFDIPELRELLLPVLRTDFEWLDAYRYEPEAPLPVPIVAFAGDADPVVSVDLITGWGRHTSESFRLHTMPGNHFFLHATASRMLDLITADLAGAAGPSPGSGGDPTAPVAVGDQPTAQAATPSNQAIRRQGDSAVTSPHTSAAPAPGTHEASAPRPRAAAGPDEAAHRVALPGTDWGLWRSALLRTTGFPVDGLDRLAATAAASAADRHLSGELGAEEYAAAYAQAVREVSAELVAIADDPLFREAVTWQNRNALYAINGLREQGPEAARNSKRRQREEVVARYWQRYCAKNETVGFFGPVCWVTLDPQGPNMVATPGPDLIRRRRVFFDYWALAAYADTVAADPRARRWLPPALLPQMTLDGRQLLRPAQPPVQLSAVEAALLARCDGRRPAVEVVESVVAAPGAPLRTAEDGFLLLSQLADRGLVRWNLDLPVRLNAEEVLERRLAAIGDEPVRQQALAGLARLRAARDRVAAAAGDPDALAVALAALDAEFTELTGQEAQRKGGETYAGRTICVEECDRDLQVVLGGEVIAQSAPPLAVLLQAARWLSAAAAEAYLTTFRSLYAELAEENGSPQVPFGELWYLAQGLVFGQGELPIDEVSAEFARRWTDLFGLEKLEPGTRLVTYTSAELADAVRQAFPAERPGWSAARVHAPDLHVCAESVEALARGEFSLVLGEMHAALVTFDSGLFLTWAPSVEQLRDGLRADAGSGRVLPLLPTSWPRYTARLAAALDNESDWQLGFVPAPGADPERLLPVTALTVQDEDGELVVSAADGRRWPLIEMFADLIGIHTQGAFKLVAASGHSPRIMVDRMVVARETWRTTIGETGLADVRGEAEQYLAVRRWRAALGLPERIFVSVSTETKPCYVDLTSPVYVSMLCGLLRAARRSGGAEVRVTVSEMYPTTDQAWVTDAAGRRYLSELRIQVTDPALAHGGRQS